MNVKDIKYISLQEATKYCNYSQEYLSLRARQGKLKAVKFGRNWVTKKEWVEEYLRLIEDENKNLINKKTFPSYRLSLHPKPISEATTGFAKSISNQFLTYITVLFFALVFVVVIIAPFSSQKTVSNNPLAASIIQDFFNPTSELFKEYIQWLDKTIKSELSSFALSIKTKFSKKEIAKETATPPTQPQEETKVAEEQVVPETTTEGMVVIPSTSTNEEAVKKIKESFSDEVQVEQKDIAWGIIKPIFKNPNEQSYIYIMVPISTSSQSTTNFK